jgi:hypothetical protein
MEQSNLRVTLATKMHKKAQASALPSFSISFSAYLMFFMPTTFFSLHIIIASPIRLNFAFNLNAKGYLDKSIRHKLFQIYSSGASLPDLENL